MNFIILFFIIIFISILASILVFKNEDKKDKILAKRKQEKIYNDFIELSKSDSKAEYKEYLNSPHWKEIRLKALARAGNRCQLCSSTDSLNVHHNTYRNRGNEDLKDLVVLCRNCHEKFHDIVN